MTDTERKAREQVLDLWLDGATDSWVDIHLGGSRIVLGDVDFSEDFPSWEAALKWVTEALR